MFLLQISDGSVVADHDGCGRSNYLEEMTAAVQF